MSVSVDFDLQHRWVRGSFFKYLRRIVIPLIVTIIAAIVGEPTWELIVYSSTWLRLRFAHLIDSRIFHTVFKYKTFCPESFPTIRAWRSQHA